MTERKKMNEPKNQWSIIVTNTYYVKTLEKDEICCGYQDLIEAYDHLHIQWIGADELIRRFSHLFTNFVRYEEKPVVTTILQSGLVAYANILQKAHEHYYPHERLKHFLVGCFAKAKDIGRFRVIDKNEGEMWSLLHQMPLSLWRFNRTALEIQKLDIDPDYFTELLYEKIVPENMKRSMRRFKHEAAIICALGSRH